MSIGTVFSCLASHSIDRDEKATRYFATRWNTKEEEEIGRSCDWPGVLRATEAAEARWTRRAHREHAQRVFYSSDNFAFPLHQTHTLSLSLSLRHPGTHPRIFIYLRAGSVEPGSSSRFRDLHSTRIHCRRINYSPSNHRFAAQRSSIRGIPLPCNTSNDRRH